MPCGAVDAEKHSVGHRCPRGILCLTIEAHLSTDSELQASCQGWETDLVRSEGFQALENSIDVRFRWFLHVCSRNLD